jgi:hypothetical protein
LNLINEESNVDVVPLGDDIGSMAEELSLVSSGQFHLRFERGPQKVRQFVGWFFHPSGLKDSGNFGVSLFHACRLQKMSLR